MKKVYVGNRLKAIQLTYGWVVFDPPLKIREGVDIKKYHEATVGEYLTLKNDDEIISLAIRDGRLG